MADLYTEQRIKEKHHIEKIALAQIPSGTAEETFEKPIFVAPRDGTITKIVVVPAASISGDDTDYFVMKINNKTQATVVAIQSMTPSTSSWAWWAGIELTVDNATLSEGDVISFEKDIANSGLINPDMCVAVTFRY
ncbi:MAG: hypothetical protein N2V78_08915 [Methanophagales archaeon]|nr:hypothetical protein [Methanophagales archaeon]